MIAAGSTEWLTEYRPCLTPVNAFREVGQWNASRASRDGEAGEGRTSAGSVIAEGAALAPPRPGTDNASVFVIHGTRKFLDRVGGPNPGADELSTTALGAWYATAIFSRPQVALFVNEITLFPVMVPLSPAGSVVARFRAGLERLLVAQRISPAFVADELGRMDEHRLATTASRSVVGVMNEFVHLGNSFREPGRATDLDELSEWLAATPCGPLYRSQVSPDRELRAFVARRGQWQ